MLLETHTLCLLEVMVALPRLTSPEWGVRGCRTCLVHLTRSQQPWACPTSPRRWLLSLHDFPQWKQLDEGWLLLSWAVSIC